MKILIASTAPWEPTAYGKHCGILAEMFTGMGHEVGIAAVHGLEGGPVTYGGTVVYPARDGNIDLLLRYLNPDVLVSYHDVWIYRPGSIPESVYWIPYFPVDSDPVSSPIVNVLKAMKRGDPLVYSNYGLAKLGVQGIAARAVPLGVDASVYYVDRPPEGEHKRTVRVLLNAANIGRPSRKAFAEQLLAFDHARRELGKEVELTLTLHTRAVHDDGMNLPHFIKTHNISGVLFSNQTQYILGDYDEQDMRRLYNEHDMLLSCSAAEGYGLPIIEAQACGLPVVVGGWTSMPELVVRGSVVHVNDSTPLYNAHNTQWRTPNVAALSKEIQATARACVNGCFDREHLSRVTHAMYDLPFIRERYWEPVMERAEADVAAFKKTLIHELR